MEGARILIVDDNEINRSILNEQMQQWGFDACAVENGDLALLFLEHAYRLGTPVDLLILDYQMPGMNGAELLRRIRRTPHAAEISVVLLTSMDDATALRDLKSAGARAILTKPARAAHLKKAITDLLAQAWSKAGPALPRRETRPTPKAKTEGPARVISLTSNMGSPEELDILVAEDNEVNQLLFRHILEGTVHRFAIAANGQEAVALWRQRRPRLVLMDVSMPEMNGLEATEAIRLAQVKEKLWHTPIIGLTAHALEGDRDRCLEAGMDDYMTKPVSPARLEAKIAEWLPEREAARA